MPYGRAAISLGFRCETPLLWKSGAVFLIVYVRIVYVGNSTFSYEI